MIGSPRVFPLREKLLEGQKQFLFTSKRGAKPTKMINSEIKSRNPKNVGISMNTSRMTDQYCTITRVRNPSQKDQSFDQDAQSFIQRSSK